MSRAQKVSSLKVAAATITPCLEPSATRERIRAVVENTMAAHPNVRLILFGEVILGWFGKKGHTRAYHQSIAEPIPGTSTRFVGDLAREYGIYISFGLSERAGDAIYNTQVLLSPGGELVGAHRKFWIMNPAFSAGERTLTTAQVDGANVALLVCADVRSLSILRAIRKGKVDLVLAGLADHGTDTSMSEMIGTFFDAWAITANRYGTEDAICWRGMTTITDRWGRLVQSSVGRECVLVQDVEVDRSSACARFARRTCVAFRAGGLIAAEIARQAWSRASRSSRDADGPHK